MYPQKSAISQHVPHIRNDLDAISISGVRWSGLTEVRGSEPPVPGASPATSRTPSGEGNSLRLQVLLRFEQREWEEAQAWEGRGKGEKKR